MKVACNCTALFLFAVMMASACEDDEPSRKDSAVVKDSSTNTIKDTSTSGGNDTSTGGNDGSSSDMMATDTMTDGMTVSSLCMTYCNAMDSYCTGANAQFANRQECETECAGLPEGTAGANSGNSVNCRITHANLANSESDPATHCPHAGGAAPCN